MVVKQADGVSSQNDVALHTTVGALDIGNELRIDKRIAAEHGNGEYSTDGIFGGYYGVTPV